MGLLQGKTRLATIWEEREPYGDYYEAPEMNDFYHENHNRLPSEVMNHIAQYVHGSRRYVSSHFDHDTQQYMSWLREEGAFMRGNMTYNEDILAKYRKQIAYQHVLLKSARQRPNTDPSKAFHVQYHLDRIQEIQDESVYYARKVAAKHQRLMRALR